MNQKTTVDNLAATIAKTLKDFEGATDEACADGVLDTAQDAVKKLHSAHPSGSEGSPAGVYGSWNAYNKGWAIKAEKKRKSVMSIVHNKTKYRLTHLLEKGHAKVNGGRTQSFPHIAPVAEAAEEELVKNIKKRIERS